MTVLLRAAPSRRTADQTHENRQDKNVLVNLYNESLAAFRAGDTDEAARLAEELLSESRTSGDKLGEVDGLCMLARVALRRGELQLVAMLAGEGRAIAKGENESSIERMPLHLEAVAARMRGDFPTARQLYRENIALNRQLGDERMVAGEYRNLAYVELHDGNPAEAVRLFSSSADLARESGYDGLGPYLLLDSAVLAFEIGDVERARELLAETRAGFTATGEILDPDDAAEAEWLSQRLDHAALDP